MGAPDRQYPGLDDRYGLMLRKLSYEETPQQAPGPARPRGLPSLVPPAVGSGTVTAGHRAASRLLGLRDVTVPAAVLEAAAELLADALDESGDPVTQGAVAATLARLRGALGQDLTTA